MSSSVVSFSSGSTSVLYEHQSISQDDSASKCFSSNKTKKTSKWRLGSLKQLLWNWRVVERYCTLFLSLILRGKVDCHRCFQRVVFNGEVTSWLLDQLEPYTNPRHVYEYKVFKRRLISFNNWKLDKVKRCRLKSKKVPYGIVLRLTRRSSDVAMLRLHENSGSWGILVGSIP